jgi:3-dehydroquinate synthase
MDTLTALHQEIRVSYRFGVYFTPNVFARDNSLLAETVAAGGGVLPRKILAVVDDGLYAHHPRLLAKITQYVEHYRDHLQLAGPPLLVPGGERAKNDTAPTSQVLWAIHRAGLCRHSYVLAVGGGAVIDMAGYAAATAHRGLRLLRVPTTVMAQADASIGVKNSINAFGKKNFLGTFAPPWAVFNDCTFLTTLSRRDWLSGVAEALKVALIKDADFFAWLEEAAPAVRHRDLEVMQRLIHRTAALHLDHIAYGGDPFESGSSRPLDFGHWAAHKLEQMSSFELRHGEAVAIGIALDATYSYLTGLLAPEPWRRLLAVLHRLGLPIWASPLEDFQVLYQGLQEFREHLGGRLTVMLLADIGHPLEVHELERGSLQQAVALLKRRAGGRVRAPAPPPRLAAGSA